MYHSITFEDLKTGKKINTYDDWFLAATTRPVVNPPKQKTQYVDIPGADGDIDMSEALTGYPVFNDRDGSITFYVLNTLNGIENPLDWFSRFDEIGDYLHGKILKMTLEDDPNYYYLGRFALDKWETKPNNSEVTINYHVDPYKWRDLSTIEDWLWDPFNFDTDWIDTDFYKDLEINSPNEFETHVYEKEYELVAPVIPTFHVSNMTQSMEMEFINPALQIDVTYPLVEGDNYFFDCVITNTADWTMKVKGVGTLSVVYKKGRL